MTDHIDDINDYLDGKMPLNERKSFEERLRNDKSLADEFEFEKELSGYYKKQKKANLSQELTALGDEFMTEERLKPPISRWIFFFLIAALGVFSYFAFFKNTNAPVTNIQEEETKQPKEQEKSTLPIQEENNDETVEPKNPTTPNIPDNQPIATLNDEDFKRNPLLEDVIKERYRDNTVKITVTSPLNDATFKFENKISLLVSGQTNVKPKYQLVVYSNRTYDIENDFPALNIEMDGKAIGNEYAFRFNAEVPLKRGLYYLIIRDTEMFSTLHISRFMVE